MNRIALRISALLFCFAILAGTARAQDTLRSPAAFLGYALGERYTTHDNLLAYFAHAAQHSPRIKLQPFGKTNEGRTLIAAFIASEANLSKLEEIRTDNLMRTGLLPGTPKNPSGPAICWLSYNIHGNEAVSSEASMQMLYELLRPGSTRAAEWLKRVVVVIDPCMNPDGRERFVSWQRQQRSLFADANPAAREHAEPWPYGRTNHYYFDLNRDWAWQTQVESRQRTALYQQWMPHIHADFHEMGSNRSYYFLPAAEPYHEQITSWQREFQEYLGNINAKNFSDNGWRFFTREDFDLFYPSYGDSWPTFQGAIGMTYEQAGAGGTALRLNNGDTLTLAARIAHQYTTGVGTVQAAYDKQEQLVKEFEKYFKDAQNAPPGPYKGYVFRAAGNPGIVKELTQLFDKQGITYSYANAAEKRLYPAFNYLSGKTENVQLQETDLVVSAYQPRSGLLRVLMDPKPKLSDSMTYDITAWALPYAYNVKAFAMTERVSAGKSAPAETVRPAATKPYGYLHPWQSFADVKQLAAWLKAGLRVRVAERPFTVFGISYPQGTLVLLRADNEKLGDKFDAALHTGTTLMPGVTAVTSGRVEKGFDFGSDYFRILKKPRVAVLAGSEVNNLSLGELWFYFEQELGYPITLISTQNMRRLNYADFDILLLAEGDYADVFSGKKMEPLQQWVTSGGKIIALESALRLFAGKDGYQLKEKSDTTGAKKLQAANALRPYADRERTSLSDFVAGAIYRLRIDNTHPLGYGFGDEYYTLRGSTVYDIMKDGGVNVATLKKDGHVAGFVGANLKKKLDDGLVFGVERKGQGSIVYLTDDPIFRNFWVTGKLLLGNAIFMVGN